MSKIFKNEVVQEAMDIEETQVETKAEGIVSKGVKCVKRNGKKVLGGAALLVGAVVCYTLGKKAVGGDSDECYESFTADDGGCCDDSDCDAE